MEGRKWENLSSDCLVNIFKRLDLEMLLLDVPLVCKNWNQALLDPLCWQKLVFPSECDEWRLAYALEGGAKVPRVLNFVLNRSQGLATTVDLPSCTNTEDILHVIDKCPALRLLTVPSCTSVVNDKHIPQPLYGCPYVALARCLECSKRLEYFKRLFTRKCNDMLQIIDKIGLQCKDFSGLSVQNAEITDEVASAIVSKLATIKYLILDEATLDKEHLEMILLGCKDLELLYIFNSVSLNDDAYDKYILELASRIKDFRY